MEENYSRFETVNIEITHPEVTMEVEAEIISLTCDINYYEDGSCSVPDINISNFGTIQIDDMNIDKWIEEKVPDYLDNIEELKDTIQEFVKDNIGYKNKNIIQGLDDEYFLISA